MIHGSRSSGLTGKRAAAQRQRSASSVQCGDVAWGTGGHYHYHHDSSAPSPFCFPANPPVGFLAFALSRWRRPTNRPSTSSSAFAPTRLEELHVCHLAYRYWPVAVSHGPTPAAQGHDRCSPVPDTPTRRSLASWGKNVNSFPQHSARRWTATTAAHLPCVAAVGAPGAPPK